MGAECKIILRNEKILNILNLETFYSGAEKMEKLNNLQNSMFLNLWLIIVANPVTMTKTHLLAPILHVLNTESVHNAIDCNISPIIFKKYSKPIPAKAI